MHTVYVVVRLLSRSEHGLNAVLCTLVIGIQSNGCQMSRFHCIQGITSINMQPENMGMKVKQNQRTCVEKLKQRDHCLYFMLYTS